MDRSQVQDWLDRYIAAWRANQREPIEALFTEDATYRFRPYDDNRMARGIGEIIDAWLNQPDDPNSWDRTRCSPRMATAPSPPAPAATYPAARRATSSTTTFS